MSKFLIPTEYHDPMYALKTWGFTFDYIESDGLVIHGKHSVKYPSLSDLEYESSVKGKRIKIPVDHTVYSLREYLKKNKIYNLEE